MLFFSINLYPNNLFLVECTEIFLSCESFFILFRKMFLEYIIKSKTITQQFHTLKMNYNSL